MAQPGTRHEIPWARALARWSYGIGKRRIDMFGRHKETSWTKVVAALAALKLMPIKKTLFGIAAIAGAVYAYRRIANNHEA